MTESPREIEQILFAEIGSALQRVVEASDAVKLNAADMPTGKVAIDDPRQKETACEERTSALTTLTEAIERLHAFTLHGNIPDRLREQRSATVTKMNYHEV